MMHRARFLSVLLVVGLLGVAPPRVLAVDATLDFEWASSIGAIDLSDYISNVEHAAAGTTLWWTPWLGTRAMADIYRFTHKDGGHTTDGAGLSISGVLRHQWADERYAIYVAGDLGILQTDDYIPDVGTKGNFTERVRVGFQLEAADNVLLDLGARYVHISNAGFGGRRNPGVDYVSASMGLAFRY